MYLLSSLLTTGCIILRDKGLHMLPQAELDCCFKHLRLLMSVLLLQMRLPNWSSYLTVSTGYLRSGWVYLCLELLLLEIDSSFHLWLLKHHKLWLDCPAKQRKRARNFLCRRRIVRIHLVLGEGYRSVRVKQVNWWTQTCVQEILELMLSNQRSCHAPHWSQNWRQRLQLRLLLELVALIVNRVSRVR